MQREEILRWLRTDDPARQADGWRRADEVRRAHVGDAVHVRGLVEWSNHCRRACLYCGIRAERADLARYRLTDDEVLACARRAVGLGYGSLVLQAGEDPALTRARVAAVVRRIKRETPLAVTLSLGERDDADTAAWREAGADRYLLRFETSDRALYARLHPAWGAAPSDRPAQLRRLRAQGYEIGGGMMVGLPGQTFETLADDLLLCRALDLDMIGVGPYLPDPHTPLGVDPTAFSAPGADAPKADARTTLTVLALARLLCPDANLPSTTALGVVDPDTGRADGLASGANVVMPNLTPAGVRALYAIYPAKASWRETAEAADATLAALLAASGRTMGHGPGGRGGGSD